MCNKCLFKRKQKMRLGYYAQPLTNMFTNIQKNWKMNDCICDSFIIVMETYN